MFAEGGLYHIQPVLLFFVCAARMTRRLACLARGLSCRRGGASLHRLAHEIPLRRGADPAVGASRPQRTFAEQAFDRRADECGGFRLAHMVEEHLPSEDLPDPRTHGPRRRRWE